MLRVLLNNSPAQRSLARLTPARVLPARWAAPALCGLWSLALAGLVFSGTAAAQQPAKSGASQNVYIVTHIDVMPDFAAGANKAIQKYASDSRKDRGAVSVEGLVQDGRPNHFTIVEIWRTRADFEAHSGMAHVRAFRETMHPMLGAPFDERLHEPMP